jgi:hypothetical protein
LALVACNKTADGGYEVQRPVAGTVTDTVHPPDVTIGTKTETVAVPKVEVKHDSATIKVPTISVHKGPGH